jgi:hypothetical protein
LFYLTSEVRHRSNHRLICKLFLFASLCLSCKICVILSKSSTQVEDHWPCFRCFYFTSILFTLYGNLYIDLSSRTCLIKHIWYKRFFLFLFFFLETSLIKSSRPFIFISQILEEFYRKFSRINFNTESSICINILSFLDRFRIQTSSLKNKKGKERKKVLYIPRRISEWWKTCLKVWLWLFLKLFFTRKCIKMLWKHKKNINLK